MIKTAKMATIVTSSLLVVSVSSSIALAEPFVVHDQNGHVVQVPSALVQLPLVENQEPSAEYQEPSAQYREPSAQIQEPAAQKQPLTIQEQQALEQQALEQQQQVLLEQGPLDQILAPIALYPDSLLSQILVAATYPLEVVQAARWRQENIDLSEDQVLAIIETKDWDPSVKALAPFTDLIDRLSQDLDWLQQLGDAFLQNEQQVISSIQYLRQKAHETGSIANNDYYNVETENDNIIITSTNRERPQHN